MNNSNQISKQNITKKYKKNDQALQSRIGRVV